MEWLALLKEVWKAPAAQRFIFMCLFVAIGVPVFLGYYYSDVMDSNARLEIANDKLQLRNEGTIKYYQKLLNDCDLKMTEREKEYLRQYNEYRDKTEAYNRAQAEQMQKDYKEAQRLLYNTNRVIDKIKN